MCDLAVFVTDDALVTAAHQTNVQGQAAVRQRAKQFLTDYGFRPEIIEHPDGVCAVGVLPNRQDEIVDPPHGWMADPAREVLHPDCRTSAGRERREALRKMRWEWSPLPGLLDREGAAVVRLPVLEPSEVLERSRLRRPGALVGAGRTWAVAHPVLADFICPQTWERSRRAHLVEALAPGLFLHAGGYAGTSRFIDSSALKQHDAGTPSRK